MSTKGGTMATRAQTLVQVQNLNIHNKGFAGVSMKTSRSGFIPRLLSSRARVVTGIEEEQCQQYHQCCVSLQTKTSTQHFLNQILSLDDEKSPLELWSPKTPLTILNQSKVKFASTPKYLDFTQSPVSLKY